MATILPVVIGAIITAVIGNFLVQRWQLRTWRTQQRQIGYQAELESLKSLLDEMTRNAANRYNAMRRLIGSLAPQTSLCRADELTAYQEQLAVWNGSLDSIFVRVRLAAGYGWAIRFERQVHDRFVAAGRAIEDVVRAVDRGTAPSWTALLPAKHLLRAAKQGSYDYMRDLADVVEGRREQIYFGHKLFYREDNLPAYSLVELVKAAFVADVDGFYVVHAA